MMTCAIMILDMFLLVSRLALPADDKMGNAVSFFTGVTAICVCSRAIFDGVETAASSVAGRRQFHGHTY